MAYNMNKAPVDVRADGQESHGSRGRWNEAQQQSTECSPRGESG